MSHNDADFRTALSAQYLIQRELGRGGMATVYLATDQRNRRRVAIKVLDPQIAHLVNAERFAREIQLLATMQHPHILPLFDSGSAAGLWYYVMPFVEGETLRARLNREKRLGVADAVRIAGEVAAALDYAHRRGVIHRDIKPENILLSDGHALVADFGIARALLSDPEAAQRLTATGVALGTPGYMSPEQAAGDPSIDARADLFALGAVTYEMLAGQAPFAGPTAQAVLARALTGAPPSLEQLRPGIPKDINLAVQRALATEPSDRFATAPAFAEALNRSPAHASRPALGRSMRVGAALVLLSAAGVYWWNSLRGTAIAATRVAVLPFRDVGVIGSPGFSEGLTAALRRDLATMPNVDVIAGATIDALGDSARNPRYVATQLSATHVLAGTVQWSPGTEGAMPFRVAPEIIHVLDGHRVSAGAAIEGQVDNLFQTQARLSIQLARSIGVPLSAEATTRLSRPPTKVRAAYEAYLGATLGDDVNWTDAISGLRGAVALDSNFIDAWATLGQVAAQGYRFNVESSTAELARDAAAKAMSLDSTNTGARLAALAYERHVARNFDAAVRHGREALRLSPGDAEAAHYAAAALLNAGLLDEALVVAKRGADLDPRNASAVNRVANILQWMRDLPGAEGFGARAIALSGRTTGYINLDSIWFPLARGDTAAARRFITSLPSNDARADLAVIAARDWLQGWALDDETQALGAAALRTSASVGHRALYYVVAAQRAWLREDTRIRSAMVDSAERSAADVLRRAPNEELVRMGRGYALALDGRCTAGLAQADSANATRSIQDDAFVGAGITVALAEVLAVCGERERALSLADSLLRMPGFLTADWLRVDPHFARLRSDPRFLQLTNGTPAPGKQP